MNRRTFLKILSCGSLGLWTYGCGITGNQPKKTPNFILIMADDLGYGDLGCYGSHSLQTTHIDSLARNGLKFNDFHSNGPVCSPTRAALLTGRYQQRCGIEGVVTARNHRETGMPLEEATFAEILGNAGYATALFGKWHLGYPERYNPVHQGFQQFRGFVSGNVDYRSHIDQEGYEDWWSGDELKQEEGYTTRLITRHGVQFISEHHKQPFCLYLAHESPHYPYQGPDDPADRSPGNPEPIHGSRKDVDTAYKQMISALDEGVGEIMETLRRLDLENDTLVLFFSDNGPAGPGSSGRLRGSKSSLWEGGHRVPAIASWPGMIAANSETDETVMTMDIFPTLVSLAGIDLPEHLKLDGVDLSPILFDDGQLSRRQLFWRFGEQRVVRDGHWKLLLNPRGEKGSILCNLDEDPSEETDLADEFPEKVLEMEIALSRWEKRVTAGVERRS